MKGEHILETRQFTPEQIKDLFSLIDEEIRPYFEEGKRIGGVNPRMADYGTWDYKLRLPFDYVMGTIFLQPSTRTRMSFEAAMKHLGGHTIDFGDAEASSIAKGETWQDTIEVISQYCNVICMRTPMKGLPTVLAGYSDVPIINCGSGREEHPTQALLDLYTIYRAKKRTDNLNVVIFGDVENARTIQSLKQILSLYPVNIAEIDSMKKETAPLDQYEAIFKKADVVYVTRIHSEYQTGIAAELSNKSTTQKFNEKILPLLKEDAIIMHPGPVIDEVTSLVKQDPRWVYKQQIKNGMYVRMALLKAVLGHLDR